MRRGSLVKSLNLESVPSFFRRFSFFTVGVGSSTKLSNTTTSSASSSSSNGTAVVTASSSTIGMLTGNSPLWRRDDDFFFLGGARSISGGCSGGEEQRDGSGNRLAESRLAFLLRYGLSGGSSSSLIPGTVGWRESLGDGGVDVGRWVARGGVGDGVSLECRMLNVCRRKPRCFVKPSACKVPSSATNKKYEIHHVPPSRLRP